MDRIIIAILIGYLFGNIQTAYLLGKLIKHVDIRTLGHGNSGASNALMTLGFKAGLFVALVDIAKGITSILVVKSIFSIGLTPEGAPLLYLNGLFVLLGHIFPFYMNFKGGKGTAPFLGILLGLSPIYGFMAGVVFLVVALLSDYISMGTLAVTLYLVFFTIFHKLGFIPISVSFLITLLSMKLHIENYRRIVKGEEPKVSVVLKKKKKV